MRTQQDVVGVQALEIDVIAVSARLDEAPFAERATRDGAVFGAREAPAGLVAQYPFACACVAGALGFVLGRLLSARERWSPVSCPR